MKDTKFRAWDTKDRKMVYDGTCDSYENAQEFSYTCLSIGFDGAISGHICNYYGQTGQLADIPEDRFILIRPTGLKDRDGKAIYQGDILGGIWGGYIDWCEKCKALQLLMPDGCCMACEGDVHWYELVEDDGKLEVVGNVWEHPELLKSPQA